MLDYIKMKHGVTVAGNDTGLVVQIGRYLVNTPLKIRAGNVVRKVGLMLNMALPEWGYIT